MRWVLVSSLLVVQACVAPGLAVLGSERARERLDRLAYDLPVEALWPFVNAELREAGLVPGPFEASGENPGLFVLKTEPEMSVRNDYLRGIAVPVTGSTWLEVRAFSVAEGKSTLYVIRRCADCTSSGSRDAALEYAILKRAAPDVAAALDAP